MESCQNLVIHISTPNPIIGNFLKSSFVDLGINCEGEQVNITFDTKSTILFNHGNVENTRYTLYSLAKTCDDTCYVSDLFRKSGYRNNGSADYMYLDSQKNRPYFSDKIHVEFPRTFFVHDMTKEDKVLNSDMMSRLASLKMTNVPCKNTLNRDDSLVVQYSDGSTLFLEQFAKIEDIKVYFVYGARNRKGEVEIPFYKKNFDTFTVLQLITPKSLQFIDSNMEKMKEKDTFGLSQFVEVNCMTSIVKFIIESVTNHLIFVSKIEPKRYSDRDKPFGLGFKACVLVAFRLVYGMKINPLVIKCEMNHEKKWRFIIVVIISWKKLDPLLTLTKNLLIFQR